MEGAGAVEGVECAVVRKQHVTCLRMDEPVYRLTMYHGSYADAGAHGEIEQGIARGDRGARARPRAHGGRGKGRGELAPRAGRTPGAPPILAQGRRVDVGVESDGHLERLREGAAQVGLLPAGLGSGGDVAVGRRLPVEVHRSERADPEGGDWVGAGLFAKESDDTPDGLGRRGGREACLGGDVFRPAADDAGCGRAACLDAAVQCHVRSQSASVTPVVDCAGVPPGSSVCLSSHDTGERR